MSMRLRMCDADRQEYGGPEWLDSNAALDALNDLDYDQLAAIETQITDELGEDKTLLWVVSQLQSRTRQSTLLALLRLRLWLSLRQWMAERHDGVAIKLADFKPHVLLTEMERRVPDADPPSSGVESSPTSAPGSAEDTPASETSTSPSTPGSPSDTQE